MTPSDADPVLRADDASAVERIAAALERLAAVEEARRADEIATRDARRKARPPRTPAVPLAEDKRDAAPILRKLGLR